VAAVGARFLFPAISLEGRGFWVLKASPQPMRAILVSKWVAGGLPLLLMSELLTALSNLLIGAPWPLTLAGLVIVASMNAGISGLAVGMGALFPRFDIENAARIASTFGGVLYMLSGMGLMVVVVLLSLAPAWAISHMTQAPGSALPGDWLGWAVASLAALLLLPPALGLGMVRLGARALSR
jgi:ABC-2 type transport system permease protein